MASARARVLHGANRRGTFSSWIRISHHLFVTDANWAFRRYDTLCILAAESAVTFGDALSPVIFDVSSLASTPGSMILRNADGVASARQAGARINALIILAGQLSGAVVVRGALRARLAVATCTSGNVGVSFGASRALALVAPCLIEAACIGTTRTIPALINVFTAQQGVAREAGLAKALRGIAGCTFGIEAALELITRTFASVSVQAVREKWWGTHTLSVAQALFILSTLRVRKTG